MNKFTYNPNRPIEEIMKLNKKSRIVTEPKERFIKPYKLRTRPFDLERPRKLDYRDWLILHLEQDLKNKQN